MRVPFTVTNTHVPARTRERCSQQTSHCIDWSLKAIFVNFLSGQKSDARSELIIRRERFSHNERSFPTTHFLNFVIHLVNGVQMRGGRVCGGAEDGGFFGGEKQMEMEFSLLSLGGC